MLIGVDRLVDHHLWHVEEPRNFVIGERGIRHLSGVEMHLLEHRETELHERRPGNLRFDDPRIDGRAAIDDVDQLENAHVPRLGVNFDLHASAADHPERGDVCRLAGFVLRGRVVGLVSAGTNDVASQHAIFLLE